MNDGKPAVFTAEALTAAPTETPDGGLVRLIVAAGEVVGAVVILNPQPWVYRRPFLEPSDVD